MMETEVSKALPFLVLLIATAFKKVLTKKLALSGLLLYFVSFISRCCEIGFIVCLIK